MSEDAAITKELIETLEDGKNGFATAADKLEGDGNPSAASTFRQLSEQRERFSDELRELAKDYGDEISQSGTVAAALHRGWMTLKDALTGDDEHAVLDVAEQGEDHAVKEFDKALEADISPTLRAVVERQRAEVKAAHDAVRSMRDAAA